MSNKLFYSLFGALILIWLLSASLFTVDQGYSALRLRFGRVITDSAKQAIVYGPGLHLKMPFIDKVQRFDRRLRTMEIQANEMLTKEQKKISIDYFIKWRITDLSQYLIRTGNEELVAKNRLSPQLNDRLRTEIGKHYLNDTVADQRLPIMRVIREEAKKFSDDLGMQVVDVRIKNIDLPDNVRQNVFTAMRNTREAVANRLHGEGDKMSRSIRSDAEKQVKEMISNANREAAEIRASGSLEAGNIYAKAYNKDPKFYAFYRSLEAYNDIFSHQDYLVLSPKGQFFQYFTQSEKPLNAQ